MISNEDCHDPTYEVVYDNEQLKPVVIPTPPPPQRRWSANWWSIMNINRSFTKKSRNQMSVDLLDDLVFINYNMKLAEHFETNKLLIEQDA